MENKGVMFLIAILCILGIMMCSIGINFYNNMTDEAKKKKKNWEIILIFMLVIFILVICGEIGWVAYKMKSMTPQGMAMDMATDPKALGALSGMLGNLAPADIASQLGGKRSRKLSRRLSRR